MSIIEALRRFCLGFPELQDGALLSWTIFLC